MGLRDLGQRPPEPRARPSCAAGTVGQLCFALKARSFQKVVVSGEE